MDHVWRLAVLRKQIAPQEPGGDSSNRDHNSSVSTLPSSRNGSPLFIGGIIMDVHAVADQGHALAQGGSAPGRIRHVPGGVCHNIAASFYRLQTASSSNKPVRPPILVSAVGRDASGAALIDHWKSLGLSTEMIFELENMRTATVSIIFNDHGDVAASVADVDAIDMGLTPALLSSSSSREHIKQAPLIVLDGDLSIDTIEYICKAASGSKIWYEPVSAAKATRILGVIEMIDYISPNVLELRSLASAYRRHKSNRKHRQSTPTSTPPLPIQGIRQVTALHHDIALLLEAGIKNIVLTLGDNGAALCRLGGNTVIDVFYLPALPASVVNCSGAGDCLVAGFIHGLDSIGDDPEALAYGVAAAQHAVESSDNIPSSFDPTQYRQLVSSALDTMQHIQLPFFPLFT